MLQETEVAVGIAGKPDLASAAPAVREVLEPAVDYSAWGVPRMIRALGKPLPMAPLGDQAEECGGECVAYRLFSEYDSDFPVFDWQSVEFTEIGVDQGPLGWKVYRVVQALYGVPVRNSDMVFHVDQNGAIRYFHGNFYSDLTASSLDFVIGLEEASAKAQMYLAEGETLEGLRLEYVDSSTVAEGPLMLLPMWVAHTGFRVFMLDGVTGSISGETSTTPQAFQSELRNVGHWKALPGTTFTNSTITGYLSSIYNQWSTYGWDSFDNAGATMRVYYNYCFCDGVNDNCQMGAAGYDCTEFYNPNPPPYDPPQYPGLHEHETQFAFWYGGTDATNFSTQAGAIAGVGSYPKGAVVGLNNATKDILAHEFGHGFNQHTSELVYENEPGSLSEGFADCFAAMVDSANWTLFESSGFSSFYGSSAIRSLSNPHSTDLVLPGYVKADSTCSQLYGHYGKLPDHFLEKSSHLKGGVEVDFGAVHHDSGIIGKACYLLGTTGNNTFSGVTVAGQGRAATAYTFHYAQRAFLTSTSNFIEARAALLLAAYFYDVSQGDSTYTMMNQTAKAMDAVGIWSSTGNVGGSLKVTTSRLVAAVVQNYSSTFRRFLFHRLDDGSSSRMRYLQFTNGSGWVRNTLPTFKYMAQVSPTVGTVQIYDTTESSVFYTTTNNVVTRVAMQQGVVAQPPSSENLQIVSAHKVGAAPASEQYGVYGVAYTDSNNKVRVRYLGHTTGELTEALVPGPDYQVKVAQNYPFPPADLMAYGGPSMAVGDGRVWLAYHKREYQSGIGIYVAGDLCVTHISESSFAYDYAGTRTWARPTCFPYTTLDPCGGAPRKPPIVTTGQPVGDFAFFAYSPSSGSQTKYYFIYPQDDNRSGSLVRVPVTMTFTWDSTNGIVGPSRAVSVYRPVRDSGLDSVTGGVLTDLDGNQRLYYTDPSGYVSELVKHGY